MLNRSLVSPRVNLKSMFFSARSETSPNCEEVDLSAVIQARVVVQLPCASSVGFLESRHSPD